MKKPKYQIGDKVWALGKEEIIQAYIQAVELLNMKEGNVFSYRLVPELELGQGFYGHFYESKLFPTKEALIASL